MTSRRLAACTLACTTLAFACKSSANPTIAGERFTTRKILDPAQRGMTAFVFVAPEKWRDQSKVNWDYGNLSTPVSITLQAENPVSGEVFVLASPLQLFAMRPDTGFYRNGQLVNGMIKANPMAPSPTLARYVKNARGRSPNFRVVGMKELPDLPTTLKIKYATQQSGIGMKVTYELDGKPVEEEFYAVHYSQEVPYDGPQGRTYELQWGLTAIHSFRAPLGKLAARRPVFASIMKSLRPNPAWIERVGGIQKYLSAQFNAQLQAGYDQIAAAGRLSRQISANNDTMLSNIDHQLQASQQRSAPTAERRSENDKFDDYVRGVDTVNDPYYGTSQHSSAEANHWTDGYGSYRNSNDGSYDPNQAESGSWTRMSEAQ